MTPSVQRRRLRATIVTGVSQALTLAAVAVLGVLIGRRFGSDARTDGFFFANSVYAIVLFVGQSLRTTSVPALVEDPQRNVRQLVGAIGWLTLLAGAIFAALAVAIVPIATENLPGEAETTAQRALGILWPAGALQMLGGLVAALLATRERYTAAAGAYAVGAVGSIVGFVVFTPALGIDGVPLGLVVGSATMFAVVGSTALRSGGVPLGRPALRPSLQRARQLLLGASGLVAAQLIVTSSVAFAAGIAEGAATTYAYGVMAISAVLAATVSPVNVVFAPVIAREWDRSAHALGQAAGATFRAGALLSGPAVAALLLLGRAPAGWLLTALDADTIDDIFTVALILSPTLLTTLAAAIPELGVLTRQRFGPLAAVAFGAVLVHLVLSGAVVAAGGGVRWLAAAAVGTSTMLAAGMMVVALGRGWTRVAAGYLRAVVEVVVPAALAFTAAAALLQPHGELLPGAAAWCLGAAAYGTWLALRRRDELVALAVRVGLRRGS